MPIPKATKYTGYFVLCIVAGIIFSFGIVGSTHVPLQVTINQYQPTPPPQPAIPTVAPQISKGPLDPAPPPVIVTTAPLPTITPQQTKPTGTCDVSPDSQGGIVGTSMGMSCMTIEMMNLMMAFIPIIIAMPVIVFIVDIFNTVIGGIDPGQRRR